MFQVQISQRFSTPISSDPFMVYRALRSINPSPYMFFLKFGQLHLVGTSPEVLVRLEGRQAETRPIAGTRPRGRSPQEDQAMEKELLADPKERAEHVMLIDLGRNDLGRVCDHGTVKVDEMMVIERYSHVMHIVSNVVGQLAEGKDAFDLLQASFPAGTVTGAPKIRAMEIIDELEPEGRGLYAGAVGYFSFQGNMDTCITIRTIIINGNQATVQAAAGIVADSDPDREYEETVNKAKAMLTAIEVAEKGLE
ncbi:MAG: anthranilate synthase component I family protein [Candidatus Manganitrophus sp.]|nr:anthranilate synthase component I family protein [Candidatus Manganitrophus sp.]